jgi:hypothetical protein
MTSMLDDRPRPRLVREQDRFPRTRGYGPRPSVGGWALTAIFASSRRLPAGSVRRFSRVDLLAVEFDTVRAPY